MSYTDFKMLILVQIILNPSPLVSFVSVQGNFLGLAFQKTPIATDSVYPGLAIAQNYVRTKRMIWESKEQNWWHQQEKLLKSWLSLEDVDKYEDVVGFWDDLSNDN